MGYDMSFVKTGGDDYFRLNIFGMGRYVDVMYALGMVYPSESPGGWPEWNRYPDDKDKQEQFAAAHDHYHDGEDLAAGIPDEVLQAAREHVAESRRILVAHPDGGDVIPWHKFGSNDGWIVTPAEIAAALAAYTAMPNREDRVVASLGGGDRLDYWRKWIDYLRRALDADGFEVW